MSSVEVMRPWGKFEVIYQNPTKTVTVKLITVNPHSRLSLQYHRKRTEVWTCLTGSVVVELEQQESKLKEGEQFTVPQGKVHRMSAEERTEILEVSLGPFDEQDVVRLQDDYGRTGKT
ncbi:MAG: phosphomannose isomerase type II C-terminal cupin domain [Thaumarchaeota archaeon]|nr:phosphomannose isomerase type II C-terminal cupin domain [Nitrososphaerota archaeon]